MNMKVGKEPNAVWGLFAITEPNSIIVSIVHAAQEHSPDIQRTCDTQ